MVDGNKSRVGERRERKEGDMISARNQCKY
jgi:hypothetical protein